MVPIRLDSDEGLGGTSDERFGPDAVLLCSFTREEGALVRTALDQIGAEFVSVALLSADKVNGTLAAALEPDMESAVRAPLATGVPRVCFLSGMSGAEAVSVMDAIQELELPPTMFAAAVPRSINKQMLDLIDEIRGDHEALARVREQEPAST